MIKWRATPAEEGVSELRAEVLSGKLCKRSFLSFTPAFPRRLWRTGSVRVSSF
jgi:hypothetical protein